MVEVEEEVAEVVVEVVVNMVLHQYMFQHSCNNHRHSTHMKRTHRIRKVVGEAEVEEEVLHTQGKHYLCSQGNPKVYDKLCMFRNRPHKHM